MPKIFKSRTILNPTNSIEDLKTNISKQIGVQLYHEKFINFKVGKINTQSEQFSNHLFLDTEFKIVEVELVDLYKTKCDLLHEIIGLVTEIFDDINNDSFVKSMTKIIEDKKNQVNEITLKIKKYEK